jgi:predicted metal-dependent hydrolase
MGGQRRGLQSGRSCGLCSVHILAPEGLLPQGVKGQRRPGPVVFREQNRESDPSVAQDSPMAMNRLPVDSPGLESEFQRVEVQRSTRRKKTITAEIVGDALIVVVPQRISRAEEQEWVARMAARMSERRRRDRLNDEGELSRRAAELADRYLEGVRPKDIAWVTNQRSRWGSCSPEDGVIRLSLEVSEYPPWVRDYVIVHELAHLLVADHSKRFWGLVNRYPLTERARGFLIAKGMAEE